MSKATKQTQPVQQLAPRVTLMEPNPHTLMAEVERLILAGYRLDLSADLAMFPGFYTVTLALPEA